MRRQDERYRVTLEDLERVGETLLREVGVASPDARITAASLADADARGIHSHGMMRLPSYVQRLRSGGTRPSARPTVVASGGAVAVVDGGGALGQVVAAHCVELAGRLARETGTGIVVARNSHHYGASGYWVRRAASEGFIGLTTTNGGPVMAPPGSVTRTLSNTPIAIAVPSASREPVVLDMATSVAAGGRIDALKEEGRRVPSGWALDREGRPTTDPDEARAGLLLPVGGHKGYGLTVMLEFLAGVLSGSGVARQIPNPASPASPMNVGHYFHVIDPKAFMPMSEFILRVEDLIAQITGAELASDSQGIVLPGDPERIRMEESQRLGVLLPAYVHRSLSELAHNLGVFGEVDGVLQPSQ